MASGRKNMGWKGDSLLSSGQEGVPIREAKSRGGHTFAETFKTLFKVPKELVRT